MCIINALAAKPDECYQGLELCGELVATPVNLGESKSYDFC
jgi:hypothetical protein